MSFPRVGIRMASARVHAGRLVAVVLVLWLTAGVSLADPWSTWRGPKQTGVSDETGLVEKWDPRGGEGSNLLWKNDTMGGISTPIVMNGRVYTIVRSEPGTPADAEKVVCADAATGEVVWENRFNVFLSDVPAERIGWSCCAGDLATGRIYVLSSCSLLMCIDGKTGDTLWNRSLSEEFGMLSTYGGRTNTPVVFEDLVIVSGITTGWDTTARPAHRFLAFDKENARLVWIQQTRLFPEDTNYSTPFIAPVNGELQMVVGCGDGSVYGFQPRTGKTLWKFNLSKRGINASPLVANNMVYIGHSEENLHDTTMGALVAIDPTGTGDVSETAERWRLNAVAIGKSSPLLVDGRIYAVDDAAGLNVLDAQTGKVLGRRVKLGTAMKASLAYADGKIFANTVSGLCHILRPTEDGVETVQRVRFPTGVECAGSPAISDGRIYIPTTEGMYCVGEAESRPASPYQPEVLEETAATDGTAEQVAQVQLIPAEALLKPGESLTFEVRAYNSRGVRINTDKPATFTVMGNATVASVSDEGVLTAAARKDPSAPHDAVTVEANIGGVVGQARVRIVPSLSWKFDFSDNRVPITWIGAPHRYVPGNVDGEAVLVKVTTIPKGTRSQAWMGSTDLHDYTIQADFHAGTLDNKQPDMGLIAQRYTLDLMGAQQQLQIRSWPSQLRMARSTPYAWKPGIWYTLKFQASVEGDKAVLRGKVWERGQAEPSEWTLTATDDTPNVHGSPGLFGNATNGEIAVDNVTVTPNK